MKICLITTSYPVGPRDSQHAGVFVRDFALRLQRQGHTVSVFTPSKGEKIDVDPGLTVRTFSWAFPRPSLTRLNPKNPIDLFRLFTVVWCGRQALLRWAPKQAFDRILAFWAIPSGWWGAALKKRMHRPLDVWILGSDLWLRHRYPFGDQWVRNVLAQADTLFADGEDLRKEAADLSGKPVRLLRSLRQLPQARPVTLPKDKTHFIFVGRWDRVKGVDLFVDAYLSLAADLPVQAHIFGQGPQGEWLQARIQTSGVSSVTVYGVVAPDVLAGYLQAADFAVIPSRQESLPVFFFDAMQCGLPVIAADVGDLRKIIEDNQVGWVVPPDDSRALAAQMRAAVQQGKAPWTGACRRLAGAWNPDTVVQSYMKEVAQG